MKNVPIDPNGWNIITDAMSRVLLPEGTAPSAHIPGIDIAGKTGSAQIVSLATARKIQEQRRSAHRTDGSSDSRHAAIRTSWSACCSKAASMASLAARLATQVIKAYVDKQHRTPQKMVEKPKSNGNGGYRRPLDRTRLRRRQRNAAGRPLRSGSAKEAAGSRNRSPGNAVMMIFAERVSGVSAASEGRDPSTALSSAIRERQLRSG